MQWLLQDVNIGQNLRMFRKKNKLTQDAITAKMQLLGSKISVDTYSKIETGVRNIRVSDLIILSIVYDIDISNFFEGLLFKDEKW